MCKDLSHPDVGFYSGEDADSYPEFGDSDKIEGAFYAWAYHDILDLFDEHKSKFAFKDSADLYCYYYGLEEAGNVEPASDPQGHLLGKNILMIQSTKEETATRFKTDLDTVDNILKDFNKILHEERDKRPRPHLDTKIITAWNGLVLSGLSKLAAIESSATKKEEYTLAATRQVEFIKNKLYNSELKSLLRSCYGEGTNSNAATTL